MYARFGLAVYFCQALELQLVNHLMAMRLGLDLDLDEIDDLLRCWFRQEMGKHVRGIKSQAGVSEQTAHILEAALVRRNWLVHHYFRSRADRLGTIDGLRSLVDELKGYSNELQEADAVLSAETQALMDRHGLNAEGVSAASEPFLAAISRGERPFGFTEWHDLFGDREPEEHGTLRADESDGRR